MKILMISARADVGGGPEHLYQLCKALGDRVEVTIACPREEPYWDKFLSLENFEGISEIPKRKLSISSVLSLCRIVKRSDIRVVHSHGKGAGIYSRLIGLITQRPVVHTFHGLHVAEYGRFRRFLYISLEKFLSKMTRACICVSEGELTAISDAKIAPAKKLSVINNGVTIPAGPRDFSQDVALNIVSVTRYNYQKNPDLLIDIADELSSMGLKFRLVVLGDGEQDDVARVKQLATDRGIDKLVDFVGGVSNPRDYFTNADIFLSTSRWEGLPLAVLEAMSEGATVVASKVVGNSDAIVHDHSGKLFSVDNAREAAEMICKLTAEDHRRLRDNAYRKVSREFSVDAMAQKTFGVYGSVCLRVDN
ncbi:glycosyltransferase [Salipiger pacificus]|nr:glycosyltransferase [Alloyangia pacifica]MCA0948009.1 glycosyltransferase [Alloyangia pacifica]